MLIWFVVPLPKQQSLKIETIISHFKTNWFSGEQGVMTALSPIATYRTRKQLQKVCSAKTPNRMRQRMTGVVPQRQKFIDDVQFRP